MNGDDFFDQPSRKKPKISLLEGTIHTPFGLIYGDSHTSSNIRKNENTERFSEEDLKKKLFDSAKLLFENYSEEIAVWNRPDLTIDLIEVNVESHLRIRLHGYWPI